MKSLLLATVAICLTAGIASAESFTFTGRGTTGMVIATPGPMGKPVVGLTLKIETDLVFEGGSKEHSSGDCVGWSAPPASGASNNGVCASTDSAGGKSNLFFTCIADEKNMQSDCWGRIVFETGKRQGKTATLSWHNHQNADGKGNSSVGAGNVN